MARQLNKSSMAPRRLLFPPENGDQAQYSEHLESACLLKSTRKFSSLHKFVEQPHDGDSYVYGSFPSPPQTGASCGFRGDYWTGNHGAWTTQDPATFRPDLADILLDEIITKCYLGLDVLSLKASPGHYTEPPVPLLERSHTDSNYSNSYKLPSRTLIKGRDSVFDPLSSVNYDSSYWQCDVAFQQRSRKATAKRCHNSTKRPLRGSTKTEKSNHLRLHTDPYQEQARRSKRRCQGVAKGNSERQGFNSLYRNDEIRVQEQEPDDTSSETSSSSDSDDYIAFFCSESTPGLQEFVDRLWTAFAGWQAGQKRSRPDYLSPNEATESNGVGFNSQGTSSPSNQQSSGNSPGSLTGIKRRKTSTTSRTFACPFWKKDQWKHHKCGKFSLKRVKDVKQHLNRCHKPYYCSLCWENYPSRRDLDAHLRARQCEPREGRPDGLTDDQTKDLQKRCDRRLSEEDQWFRVWDIIFDSPRPHSPYIDHDLSQDMAEFREFITTDDVAGIFREYLASYGFHLPDRNARDDAVSGIISGAMDRIYDRWRETRLSVQENEQQPDGSSPAMPTPYSLETPDMERTPSSSLEQQTHLPLERTEMLPPLPTIPPEFLLLPNSALGLPTDIEWQTPEILSLVQDSSLSGSDSAFDHVGARFIEDFGGDEDLRT